MSRFEIGHEVQSRRDANKIGTVVVIGVLHAGVQYYQVNFGGGVRQTMAEQDLRPYQVNLGPHEVLATGELGGYREFQRAITYQRLARTNPLSNNIYAFNASRTRFFPYQFKPLLKFLDSANHRLLIADEVGLGKTIEAGLILTELRARRTLERVLVVCPSNLKEKWLTELKVRFDESFESLDGQRLDAFLNAYQQDPDRATLNGVISLESLRQQRVLERLEDLIPSFDLVIVDEAHYMRNPATLNRRAGQLVSRGASAMLMLTATPIHLGNENLYSLLNILDEEGFPDWFTVEQRFQLNEAIVRAQVCVAQHPPRLEDAASFLEIAAETSEIQENPAFAESQAKLAALMATSDHNEHDRRRLHLGLQRDLADLNLISHIFTRTRKREAHKHVVERHAAVLQVRFTEREREFYDLVTAFVREESARRTDVPVIQAWMLQTPQRRMASCIPAMVAWYRDRAGFSEEDLSEDVGLAAANGDGSLEADQDVAVRLREIVRRWPSDEPDSKYEHLLAALRRFDETESDWKCLIFAFYKDTLRYLSRRLAADGYGNLVLSGDTKPENRPAVIDSFRDDGAVRVLLSSRVGGEGLDFQFCDTLFNYDLPWNPMEVEQRIGRLDRIGQESKVIRIYNFSVEGTIEQRILERLYNRINIFERSIGGLEAILGDIVRELERDLLSKRLSPEDEERRIGQAALAIEREWAELQQLESQAAQLVGVDSYFEEEVAKIRDRRRYVTSGQLRRYVLDFLRSECPNTRLEVDEDDSMRLFVADDLRQFLAGGSVRYSETQLMGNGRSGVPVTFDAGTAFNRPNLEFINVLHPLVRAIVSHHEQGFEALSLASHVRLHANVPLQTGNYYFFVFKMTVAAVRQGSTLEVVVLDEDLAEACGQEEAEGILGLMAEEGEEPLGAPVQVDPGHAERAWQTAEKLFYGRLQSLRDELERSNSAFLDRRIASIRAFWERKLSGQRTRLEQAERHGGAPQYLRMLNGTIRRLQAELDAAVAELEGQRQIEVGSHEVVAGILEVVTPAE